MSNLSSIFRNFVVVFYEDSEMNKKVAMLLSGGVDSSVALYLLKEQGYDITAYYMKIWLEDDAAFLGECPWEEDLEFARAVCEKANVPLKIVNMQTEYLETVVEYAIGELKQGRTPSPDIICNQQIKFGKFFNKIDDSFDKVASGHYASIEEKDGLFFLKQGVDPVKDQTYFLTYLNQKQLGRILIPLGKLLKSEVRQLAKQFDLPNKARKDSQGICFLGNIRYNDFVKYHLGEQTGNIIEIETGKIIGQHKGYWFYTIGQRSGLGLSGGPWYVVGKDTSKNVVYTSHAENIEEQTRSSFKLVNLNWITSPINKSEMEIKIRHGATKYPCSIEYLENGELLVTLQEDETGIAPGQYGILYSNSYCLGGGVIA